MIKSKFLIIVLMLVAGLQSIYAQKYYTKDGTISFFSDAPMEKIEAINKKAASVLDLETGKIEFMVLIKAFHFEKALMQEHFNENYMESSKFPKAVFKGQIADFAGIDLTHEGQHEVNVTGDLTIHGITHEVQTAGIIEMKEATISASSTFEVAVADYDIVIPKLVRENIAKVVEIRVSMTYEELKS